MSLRGVSSSISSNFSISVSITMLVEIANKGVGKGLMDSGVTSLRGLVLANLLGVFLGKEEMRTVWVLCIILPSWGAAPSPALSLAFL